MKRDDFLRKQSMYLHGAALYRSQRDKIPYREALLQSDRYMQNHMDEVMHFMDETTSAEAVKRDRKSVQDRLDRFADDVEQFAIKHGVSFGAALIQMAKEIATDIVNKRAA